MLIKKYFYSMRKIFTKLFLLATIFLTSTNLFAQTYNGGTWYSLYNATEYKNKDNTFSVFSPTTGSLSFQWKKTGWLFGYPIYKLYVSESSNGSNYTQNYKLESGAGTKQDSYVSVTTTVSENITHLKFEHDGGSLDRFYKDVKIPLKQHILIADDGFGKEKESKSFGNVTIGNISAAQTVKLRSFLTAGNITITSNNPAFRVGSSSNQGTHVFNVGANACASANGSGAAGGGNLGAISNYAVNIYFCPTEAKEYSATITITDGTSTATINVSGTGIKKDQFIIWSDEYADGKLPKGKIVENAARATSNNNITYKSSNESVIAIINDGAAFQAIAEGEATITATAAEDNEWKAIANEKLFIVTEKVIQSIHWTDNLTRLKVGGDNVMLSATAMILTNAETNEYTESPERTELLTFASNNTDVVTIVGNVLTIVGEGETTVSASLPGDEYYEAITIEMPVKVRAISSLCEAYVLDDAKERELNTIDDEEYSINGPAHQLTFTANRTALWGFTDGNLKVDAYYNGGWHKIFDEGVTKDNYTSYGPITLDRNTTKLKFYTTTGATGYKHIKDVVVSQATYLETTTSSIVVEKSIIGDVIEKSIQVQYSNLPEGVFISNTSGNITLSASELNSDCGKYGEQTITLTIVPTEVGTIEDVITIQDEATGLSLNIPVTIHTQRDAQTIAWDQDLANIYTTDLVTLNATANTDVYYTSSDSTIAYAEGNTLVINKHGQVTITAVAAQSDKYEQATFAKDLTINAVQPIVNTWPTVEPIAYAQTLTQDMLIDGEAEVEGVFEWNTELNQTLLPGTYDLAVRFVPANSNYYAPVDGTVAVTINKSAQSIVWNDSFDNITVTDSIVLNASAQTKVTYAVSDIELAYITDNNVLYFLRGGALQVTAYAEEDAYYLADTLVRELEILPAYPTIETYPTASPISYGQLLGESELSGGVANVSGTFAWVDPAAELEAGEYHQNVLFTPDDQVSYKNIEIPVIVLVKPIEQTITWELNTIEVRQGQSLQFNAVASSNLPITYSVDNNALAKVENNTFYALEVGEVVVTATQDGTYTDEDGELHANYVPAEPISKTIIIVPQQSPQTIVWNDDLSNVVTTDDITLSAIAQTPIHYLSSDSTIAYVEADKLIIKRFGTLTITAVAQQTEDYDQAILEKTLTIVAATPNVIAWPTVQPVTYGTKLNVNMLQGGEAKVDGYFEWNTDLSQEFVPGTYTLGVRFVPANLDIYATVLDSVEVIVNKAPQTIVWNNNFDHVLVSDTIILDATALTEIAYEISDIEVATLEGTLLYFHRGGTINVTAYAAESELYLADTLVRELIVHPGNPIIYNWPTASDITYGQLLGESILTGGQASTDGIFEWVDPNETFEVGSYAPYVRFTPDDQASFAIVENQVEIHVTPALQTIEWELTDFVMEVGDTLHLTAVATSGLEVTYTLDNEELAEISSNILIGLQVGMVTITASQSGVYVDEFGDKYANYLAAEPVSKTVTIVAKDINTGADMIFNEVQAAKVIRDGRLYIIRNGHIYNANGQVIE